MNVFEIKILTNPLDIAKLKEVASKGFGELVKAVIDVENETMAISGELHVDMEAMLIKEKGALRNNTWGINLYPDKTGDEFLEFDSMINLKPAFNNRTRNVENPQIQEKIRQIVKKWIIK